MTECETLVQVDKVDKENRKIEKRKKHPIFKVSSKLGVMDEEMEGEASELIFLYLFKLFMFFL